MFFEGCARRNFIFSLTSLNQINSFLLFNSCIKILDAKRTKLKMSLKPCLKAALDEKDCPDSYPHNAVALYLK